MFTKHNFFILFFFIVLGICVLLGTIGYLITEMVVADYPEQFSKIELSLAQRALMFRNVTLDNPIQILVIRKYQIMSLEFNDPPEMQIPSGGLLDDLLIEPVSPKIPFDDNKRSVFAKAKVPDGFPISHLQSRYKVKIRAYTFFAIPVTTLTIWMKGPCWTMID